MADMTNRNAGQVYVRNGHLLVALKPRAVETQTRQQLVGIRSRNVRMLSASSLSAARACATLIEKDLRELGLSAWPASTSSAAAGSPEH